MDGKASKIRLLFVILSQRRFLVFAIILTATYIIIYLAAIQHLLYTMRMDGTESFFMLKFLPNWPELIFRQRAPFLFEPIGVLYIGPALKLFLSIPNIAIALLLGSLVGINGSISYYSFRQLALKGVRGFVSLLGTIPAIVSGAACCVPTIILVIGLQLTATLATLWSFFVPLSVLLLLLSLWWSLHKIETKRL